MLKSTCAIGLTSVLAGLPITSYADNCSVGDRVPLPRCVLRHSPNFNGIVYAGEEAIHNKCSEPITVKVDRPGSDALRAIQHGEVIKETVPPVAIVSCCPKYGRCAY